MRILAIETSCDETSVAVVEKKASAINSLSNVVSSSANLHAQTGGIIPENAAREQVKLIIPVLVKALHDAGLCPDETFESARASLPSIDAIAVTYGPGLIGSLLVGVETAKTLSWILQKPIIPVSHLIAHIYANFIDTDLDAIKYPAIGLIVSGGHTDLLVFRSATDYEWIGGTRDDAAGEAFDKIGRLLDLPYPAGPEIEKCALNAPVHTIAFSKPLLHSPDFDFSFSGLKTEAGRYITHHSPLTSDHVNTICFAVQDSITTVLAAKVAKAVSKYSAATVFLGGGVSANNSLRSTVQLHVQRENPQTKIMYPPLQYCTDNAAMIGATALILNNPRDWQDIKAEPELYFA